MWFSVFSILLYILINCKCFSCRCWY
jgi:hypothetical protein